MEARTEKSLTSLREKVTSAETLCTTQTDELGLLKDSATALRRDFGDLHMTMDNIRQTEKTSRKLIVELDSAGSTVSDKIRDVENMLNSVWIVVADLPGAEHLDRLKTVYNDTISNFLKSEGLLDDVEQRIETLCGRRNELDKSLSDTVHMIGSGSNPLATALNSAVARLDALELRENPTQSMPADVVDPTSIAALLGVINGIRGEVKSIKSQHISLLEYASRLEEFQRDLQGLWSDLATVRRSDIPSSTQPDVNDMSGQTTTLYTTKSFEIFMKQEVCLLSE